MIDAAIPLATQAPNPLAQLAQLSGLQQQQANVADTQAQTQQRNLQNQSSSIALNQAQQGQAAQQALNASLAKNTTVDPTTGLAKVNRGGVIADLSSNGFAPQAVSLSQQWAQGDESIHQQTLKDAQDTLANQKNSLELHAQTIGPYLHSITQQNPNGDPNLWQQATQTFVQNGWAKPGDIPAQPNPAMAQQIFGTGISAQDQITNAQKGIDEAENVRKDTATEAQAAATLANTQAYQHSELNLRQQSNNIESAKLKLAQGDPSATAQLLVNGDVTLSELKSRGSTPEQITQALQAASALSGGKYNALQADAQYNVAKSPAQIAFFGSAKSLTNPGGTLDQLAQAAKDIPANQLPIFNTVADAEKAATGSGPIAKYASLLVGISDDYSKVMGGGTGSDQTRNQALGLVPANASPEGRAAAIEGIRGAVTSQIDSRIGSNPVLKRMYGDTASGGTSNGMVTVQIPGSPPGQIPAAALQKFRADHPNAQVTQ